MYVDDVCAMRRVRIEQSLIKWRISLLPRMINANRTMADEFCKMRNKADKIRKLRPHWK